MRERAGQLLRIACMILAALVVYQLAGVFMRMNPLRGTKVPELPSLASSTNNPAGGVRATNMTTATTAPTGTNSTQRPTGTNVASSVAATSTNSTSNKLPAEKGTNVLVLAASIETNIPPSIATRETNSASQQTLSEKGTNAVASRELVAAGTNVTAVLETKMAGINLSGTNVLISARASGTNTASRSNSGMNTNTVPSPSQLEMARMSARSSTMPGKPAELPPAIQARISKITDSEILGPVIRPQPMALMGIAGEFAFLRSPSGQTGMVKPGDSLGEIKLLKIGINRVLVEQDGQEKELTIFSGYGSESLLNKPKEISNETNIK